MRIIIRQLKQLIREAAAETSGKLHKGDVVTVNQSVQGMRKGERYEVITSETEHTPWGGYTTYIIKPESAEGNMQSMAIQNGHLLLTRVD